MKFARNDRENAALGTGSSIEAPPRLTATVHNFLGSAIKRLGKLDRYLRYGRIYDKYRNFTMISRASYTKNLMLVNDHVKSVPGCVVECGTWRGGMIAGIADVLGPDREYFLFDSFEGLPVARDVDGFAAKAWQANRHAANYHNNCAASEEEAKQAMIMSAASRFTLIKGWFNQTLPAFKPPEEIALLRIDADWYDSIRTCLVNLQSHISEHGIIIFDDYSPWDGCRRAVHEFLWSESESAKVPRLRQYWNDVYYVLR